MTRPLYIFDLDGTLADISHRLPILQDESIAKDERYRQFYAACVDDKPIASTISLAKTLIKALEEIDILSCESIYEEMNEVWIWTGRSDKVEQQTIDWLCENLEFAFRYRDLINRLKMRPAGDHSDDARLKESWLHAMSPEDRARLVLVVEDRQRVVDMYRRNNVMCLQCAPGNF